MAVSSQTQPDLVDDLEESFRSCYSALINQDHVNVVDQDEIKAGVGQAVQRFLDSARELEVFFLQKRVVLSAQKPEQLVKEDLADMRSELVRKDALIQKHTNKLSIWQIILKDLQGSPRKFRQVSAQDGSLQHLEQQTANLANHLQRR